MILGIIDLQTKSFVQLMVALSLLVLGMIECPIEIFCGDANDYSILKSLGLVALIPLAASLIINIINIVNVF